jgi:hypothetical protein
MRGHWLFYISCHTSGEQKSLTNLERIDMVGLLAPAAKESLMITLRLKGACAWIAFVAVIFGSLPAIAAPASSQHEVEAVAAQSSPQGIKSAAVVRALKLLATAIRKGYAPLGLLIAKLDPKSVGPFLKHSAKISDLLDDFAKIPDVTSKMVNERLFHLLSDKNGAFKIAPSLAKDIAEETVAMLGKLI